MQQGLLQTLSAGDLSALINTPITQDGRTVLFVGITVTLYFETPFVNDINYKLCECMSEYLRLAPTPPRIADLPKASKLVDLTKHGFISPFDALTGFDPNREWEAMYIWAASEKEAAQWYVETVRENVFYDQALSYFHVTFPFNWGGRKEVVDLVRLWSERLNVFHGYAGYSLLLPPDQSAKNALDGLVFVAAKQFPGLNIDTPALHRGLLLDGIKTVDWLTVLGKHFVDKLGGCNHISERLNDDFTTMPLATGGLLIQAGKLPQLGDTGNGDALKLYKDLNRVLKPVRIVDYADAFQTGQYFRSGRTTEPFMDMQAARAWIARFDDQ